MRILVEASANAYLDVYTRGQREMLAMALEALRYLAKDAREVFAQVVVAAGLQEMRVARGDLA